MYVLVPVHQLIRAHTHSIALQCWIRSTDIFIVIHCYVYLHTHLSLILPQTMKLVDREYCLSPPPGCPKALYEFMIQCWWVFIATNPTAAINNILSIVDNLAGIYLMVIKTATTLSCFTNSVFGYHRYVAVSPRLIQCLGREL